MNPFPKAVGVIGAVGTVATAVITAVQDPGVAALIPPHWSGAIISIFSLLILLSHSLTGTGGK